MLHVFWDIAEQGFPYCGGWEKLGNIKNVSKVYRLDEVFLSQNRNFVSTDKNQDFK